MLTKIFNITFYERDKLLYVRFFGCNFNCKICINNLSIYDTHLPSYILNLLHKEELKFLKISEFEELIKELNKDFEINYAVLGGGEPSLDPNLPRIINFLKKYDIKVRMLTNGYLLNNNYLDKLCKSKFDINDKIIISIKSIINDKHKLITGKDVDVVLSNVKSMYNRKLSISIETVHIPQLNDFEDIEELAKWISQNLDSEIELIIDPYVPIPKLEFRSPSPEERFKAYTYAKKWLNNVTYRLLKVDDRNGNGGYIVQKGIRIGWRERILGNIHLIYPHVSY